jgi:hypothetical protein
MLRAAAFHRFVTYPLPEDDVGSIYKALPLSALAYRTNSAPKHDPNIAAEASVLGDVTTSVL